jgi:hypothetical protein
MIKTSRKITSLAITLIFIIAISAPLIGAFIQEDRTISATEKRKLAQLPPRPVTKETLENFPRDFERYFNDQFGMREFFLQSFSAIKTFIGDTEISSAANKIPTKNTVKGKDGWFFLNRVWDGDPVSDYRNISLYSDIDLLRATLIYAARNDWLKRQGIRYLLFFAPNKHTIYSEYMPDYIVKQGDVSSMDQLYDALSRFTSVEFVDLRDLLIAGKKKAHLYWQDNKEEAALYYKKDSHWNGAGADIVQYEVVERMAKMFPGLIVPKRRPYGDYVMLRSTGDISLIMGRDDKGAYGPTLFTGTCSKATTEEFRQRQLVTTCETGKLNGLIFHDSFYTLPLKTFFADYFARTTFLWQSMSQGAVLDQLKKGKIDIVIEERAERFLPLIPNITSELYNEFWAEQMQHWSKVIFAIDSKSPADNKGQYTIQNAQWEQNKAGDSLNIFAATSDPNVTIKNIPFASNHLYMLHVEIDSPQNTQLQIYYSSQDPAVHFPDEKYLLTYRIAKGANVLYIPLFTGNLGDRLRFDPGNTKGLYMLKKFAIREVDPSSLQHIN